MIFGVRTWLWAMALLASFFLAACTASSSGDVTIVRVNGDTIRCETTEWYVQFEQLVLKCWAGADKTWSYVEIQQKQIRELRWIQR